LYVVVFFWHHIQIHTIRRVKIGIIRIFNVTIVDETAFPFKAEWVCKFCGFDATGMALTSFWTVDKLSTVDGVAYNGAAVESVHLEMGSSGFCPGAHIGKGVGDGENGSNGVPDGNGANGVCDGNGANGVSGGKGASGTWS